MTIKFVDFEKTTEGLVKFFRLVKNKVSSLFGRSEEVIDDRVCVFEGLSLEFMEEMLEMYV